VQRRLPQRRSGILHQKFVRVSNTIWRPGTDPVVLASSANWSKRQLRAYWQSAILFANDPALTREFALRFDSMRVCATAQAVGPRSRSHRPTPVTRTSLRCRG